MTEYYKHPDVIVAFNCRFHSDTWPESLVEMTKNHTVPLIFTSFNRYEAENDLHAVKYEFEILLEMSRNPFYSVYPIHTLAVDLSKKQIESSKGRMVVLTCLLIMTVQNIERQLKIEEKESPMWMMFVHAQHVTKSDEMQFQNKGIKRKDTDRCRGG